MSGIAYTGILNMSQVLKFSLCKQSGGINMEKHEIGICNLLPHRLLIHHGEYIRYEPGSLLTVLVGNATPRCSHQTGRSQYKEQREL